ncbi:expressed unknown protein [Seminavis robusta]|uniref:Uncharacterized protein n=1 Tax=Seminavis robusta TaxID=568900 RepID=A0A9N8HK55_9STRA|nr:expressed unknown protein [Seminavis robusta]|eukprot:Sro731_g194290.1 n/a (192) ;mRNA; f:31044-31619
MAGGAGHVIGSQTDPGSFWAVYPDSNAAADCMVDPGTKVDNSCCAALTPQPIMSSMSLDECFAFAFNEQIRAYRGCTEDNQTIYGEFCLAGPPLNGTMEECGCKFTLQGTGCYKANDFPNDPRQFFVYLDDIECEDNKMDENGEDGNTDHQDEASDEDNHPVGVSVAFGKHRNEVVVIVGSAIFAFACWAF